MASGELHPIVPPEQTAGAGEYDQIGPASTRPGRDVLEVPCVEASTTMSEDRDEVSRGSSGGHERKRPEIGLRARGPRARRPAPGGGRARPREGAADLAADRSEATTPTVRVFCIGESGWYNSPERQDETSVRMREPSSG